jgi:hypothetical protein
MAKEPGPAHGREGASDIRAVFEPFVALIDEYFQSIDDLLASEGEQEQRQVIGVLRTAGRTQAETFNRTFQEIFDAQDDDGRSLLARYLNGSGAPQMIADARGLLGNRALQRRSLLDWIGIILSVIKELLPILADLLNIGGKILKFIMALLEILDKILELLGVSLGGRARENNSAAEEIVWRSLERYWRTTAAMKAATA